MGGSESAFGDGEDRVERDRDGSEAGQDSEVRFR